MLKRRYRSRYKIGELVIIVGPSEASNTNLLALSHFKWVDSHPSMGVSQTTFPSLDGRGLRGG
jgi:hypothetical protein